MTPTDTTRFDGAVERLGRWTAARSTRRSFLHRFGQLAVFVAAGPTIAGLIVREAQARVCGQSGVTPKCDTFDCVGPGDVWGWCWYASDGCCANGGLKKICDCCTVDYPNVHGYCPSGTNVRCIVESCGTDPRVQAATLTSITWSASGGYHHPAATTAHDGAVRAVVAKSDDPWLQAVAAPLAGALGAPLLAVGPGTGPTEADLAVLRSLHVSEVVVVGPVTGTDAFTADGLTLDTVTTELDPAAASLAVADRIASINDIHRSVTVEPLGLSAEALPAAAAFATLGGYPLVVGASTAGTLGWPTVFVGPEPVDPGLTHDRTTATGLVELSIELADWAAAIPSVTTDRLAIAPVGSSEVIGLVNLGVPLVLHPANRLGALETWLQEHAVRYGQLRQIFYVDGPGALTTEQYWHLQSAANGYRVDQLQGVAGQGLPVIRQPMAERPLGMARIDGALDLGSQAPPSYWTNQGQTLRR